jgi:hypothetical protein
MLKKLIKYEFKATARIFIPLYIALMVLAIITRFSVNLLDDAPTGVFNTKGLTGMVSIFIYFSLVIGIQIITIIVQIQRFYKSLLGDEGYLMFTIPVKSWQHIVCKLFTSSIWIILSLLFAVLSILIIIPHEAFIDIMQETAEFMSQALNYLGTSTWLVGFETIIICILSITSGILLIYAAIALGHLFNKHKLLASFGMYLALSTAAQFLQTIFAIVLGATFFKDFSNLSSFVQIQTILISFLAYISILTVGFYILTKYILDKKLNLE